MVQARRRMPAVLGAAALVVAGLAAVAPVAAAPVSPDLAPIPVTTISGLPSTATTVKVGGEVSNRVVVKPAGVRSLVVQYRLGAAGAITTKPAVRTSSTGGGDVRFMPPRGGIWRYRVVIPATLSARVLATPWRQVTAAGIAGATTITQPTVTPSTAKAGTAQTIRGTVTPHAVRTVEFWVKSPAAAAFTLMRTATSTALGVATFAYTPNVQGTWSYRLYVRPTTVLKGMWSAIRASVLTDSTPPAPVTNLVATADASPTTVSLSWTNPADADLAQVIVRRAEGAVPPATPTDGTDVTLQNWTATSVQDTSLTAGTQYSYAVFTRDTHDNLRVPAVTTSITTMAMSQTITTQGDAILYQGGLRSISCPTASFCAALDGWGNVVLWNGSTWSAPHRVLTSAAAITCVSATWCELVTYAGLATHYDGTSWSVPVTVTATWALMSVSCPTTSFCMAVDSAGHFTTTTDGLAWTPVASANNGFHGFASVSCVSSDFCVAVDSTGAANVYSGAGNPTWATATTIDAGKQLTSVSCPTTTFCVAVDNGGRALTFNGSVWTVPGTIDGTAALSAVSCASATSCAVSAYGGNVTFYTGTWGTPQKPDPRANLTGISCAPATTFCAAVDNGSFGWVFRHDVGGWVTGDVTDPDNQITDMSCATPTFCLAVDNAGEVITWNGASWGTPHKLLDTIPFSLTAVSCASSTFCLVTASDGEAWWWDGSTWHQTFIGLYPRAASCVSSTFCMVAMGNGTVESFDGSTWSAPTALGSATDLYDVDCPTTTFCSAVDSLGKVHMFDGMSWDAGTVVSAAGVIDVSCPVAGWCTGLDQTGHAAFYSMGAWGPALPIDTTPPSGTPLVSIAIGCASEITCVALNFQGNSAFYDGTQWSAPAITTGSPIVVSCPSNRYCLAIGTLGSTVTLTR